MQVGTNPHSPPWAVGTGQGKGSARGWGPWRGTSSVLHVPAVACPHRGDRAPPAVVTAQDRGHRERGQAAATRGTILDRPLCQGLAMAKRRRQGKREQLSIPLFPLQIATGTFVKEENLSKLENDITNIKKKAPTGKNIYQFKPLHPPLIAPAQGRDMGCLGGGETGCAPRAALATRLLGTRGQSHISSLLGSLVKAEHLPWEAPQQPPSVTDFLWQLAFGTSPPTPQRGGSRGGPCQHPSILPSTQLPVYKCSQEQDTPS